MMASPIQTGDKVYAYLKELGYPERKIANWSMETRMYHDLGLYGDSAIEDVELLTGRFCVDMSTLFLTITFLHSSKVEIGSKLSSSTPSRFFTVS
jgi:hypothetical protein